ncbi:hypothetical protein H1R17_14055 [Flavobacterium sp. xlx-214]|uniref:hypothetical protein n=1 Tax=unclassified Flavobacterium TaxID=196869 RepID=UPI0013D04E83|nr:MULTISPECIES: hypothetical protein [unclassified Flavobacterium]MBA5791281.1 hypothetical protein [Flavobacterium sp. xlx-221]QMI83559.1 hypothetical protein H1R17_14055 [Flavobacterium sp. xlx-214]
MIKKLLLLLSFFSFTLGWTQTIKENNLYVLGYVFENINYPTNFFLEIRNDSIYFFDSNNKIYQAYKNNKVSKDSIQNVLIEKGKESIVLKFINEDNTKVDYTFFKVIEDVSIDLKNIKKILPKSTFETQIDKTFSSPNSDLQIKKSYTFSKDSLLIINNYFLENKLMYAEKELVPYELFQKNNSLFLEIKQSKENDTKRLYQIIKLNKKTLSLVYYDQREKITETFKKSTLKYMPEKEFSVCLDSHPKEYYNGDYTYTKGNNYILSKIGKNAPLAKGNGYITIHFTINCAKEIGRFGVEQMTSLYQPTTYNPELIKHLINEITLLKDWPNFEQISYHKDIHAFFMFKIKDGKIVDLCP